MAALNWLDYAFIIIVTIFAVFGFIQGLLKGVVTLLTWLVALIAAYFFAGLIAAEFMSRWFDSPSIAFWLAFVMIIVVVWIVGNVLQVILSAFWTSRPSFSDRLLGLFFGGMKSVLVLSLIIGALSYNHTVTQQKLWQGSALIPWLIKGALWVNHKMPEAFQHENQGDEDSPDSPRMPLTQEDGKPAEMLSAIG